MAENGFLKRHRIVRNAICKAKKGKCMTILRQHAILAASIILWRLLHSAMISAGMVDALKKRLGSAFKLYHIFYNLVAVFMLIPVYLLMHSMPAISCFNWSGPRRLLQLLLAVAGLFFLAAGARNYDGMKFLGLRQIFSAKHDIGSPSQAACTPRAS